MFALLILQYIFNTHQLLDAHASQLFFIAERRGFPVLLGGQRVLFISVKKAMEILLSISLVTDDKFPVTQIVILHVVAVASVVIVVDDGVTVEERRCGCRERLLFTIQFIGGAARADLL